MLTRQAVTPGVIFKSSTNNSSGSWRVIYQFEFAGSAGVIKTQSGSAKPDALITRSGNQPFAHSVSRTGQSSRKTVAGAARNRCRQVCLTRLGGQMRIGK